MKPKLLNIIIVNWNSGDLLTRCINSILVSDLQNIEFSIIVVDNNSKDHSLIEIPHHENIIKIQNSDNKGFAKACNQGINNSDGEFILFLNPDTEIRSKTIKSSIEFMKNNNSVTVLGCKQVDKSGVTLRTCARFMTINNHINKLTGLSKLFPKTFLDYHMLDWDHNNSIEVDHVMGSYYLISRQKLEEVNLFDENYFIYNEDLDLSYRIKKNGGKIFFNADIEIYHEAGGTSKQVKAKRLYYALFSKFQYFQKHFTTLDFVISLFLLLTIEPVIRIVFALAKLNLQEVNETFRAYFLLYQTIFGRLSPIKIANN